MAIKLGDSGSNSITGTSNTDFLAGQYGNDTIKTGEGFDLVDGWFGNDIVTAGSGDLYFHGGAGSDQLNLTASNDWVVAPRSLGSVYQFSAGLTNLKTGQQVALTSVEKVKIGTVTYSFRSGSDGNSTLTGTSGRDFIRGLDGNDKISTGDGDDWVSGGFGNDDINTGAGNDFVDEAFINNDFAHNDIDLGAGTDTVQIQTNVSGKTTYNIKGGSGYDVVYSDDYASFTATYDAEYKVSTLYATFFDGPVRVGSLVDVEQVGDLFSNKFITFVAGKNGAPGEWVQGRKQAVGTTGSTLSEDFYGTSKDETLDGKGGYDRFRGGAGTDTVVLNGRAELWHVGNASFGAEKFLTLTNGFDGRTPMVDIFSDVEKIRFTNGSAADTTYTFKMLQDVALASKATESHDLLLVRGTTMGDKLFLKGGNDITDGVGDVAKVDGGSGDDRIDWSGHADGAQFLGGSGDDEISLSVYVWSPTADRSVTIDGGTGDDRISLRHSSWMELATLKGGDGSDTIETGHAAKVDAGTGNDVVTVIFGGSETVGTFQGGAGTDLLHLGGMSSDFIITKSGSDYLVTNKATQAAVKVSSFEGIKFENMPVDVTKGFTTYNGSSSSVSKTGGSGVDLMHGGGGNDTLKGGSGNDSVSGDNGIDTLFGDAGDDFLVGGIGDDTLTGGTGSDMFYFRNSYYDRFHTDTITDFKSNDVLAFTPDSEKLNSHTELLKLAAQVGKDTVFSFENGDKIILKNVALGDLDQDSFYFFY